MREARVLRGVLRVARILEGDKGGKGGIIFLLHDEPLLDNYKKKNVSKVLVLWLEFPY